MGSGTGMIHFFYNRSIVSIQCWKMGYFVGGEAEFEGMESVHTRATLDEIDHCMNCTLPENFCGKCDGRGTYKKNMIKKAMFAESQASLF